MSSLRKIAMLATLPLLLATSGCFRMTIYSPLEQPDVTPNKIFVDFDDHAKWHHATLLGIVDLGATDVAALCPNGYASVHMRQTFLNGVATYVALGGLAYAPQTVRAICTDDGAPLDEGTAEGAAEDAAAE